ncbi:uncharacterized protein LOC144123208 [Amblyomma americanum]
MRPLRRSISLSSLHTNKLQAARPSKLPSPAAVRRQPLGPNPAGGRGRFRQQTRGVATRAAPPTTPLGPRPAFGVRRPLRRSLSASSVQAGKAALPCKLPSPAAVGRQPLGQNPAGGRGRFWQQARGALSRPAGPSTEPHFQAASPLLVERSKGCTTAMPTGRCGDTSSALSNVKPLAGGHITDGRSEGALARPADEELLEEGRDLDIKQQATGSEVPRTDKAPSLLEKLFKLSELEDELRSSFS